MAEAPHFIPRRPEVHGHRGCRGLRPENTLPAFLHALALGVDVVEMDVVISADNQVVVSHEPWFNSLFCLDPAGHSIPAETAQQHNLFQLDYATIRRYDCGRQPHPGFPEQAPEPAYKPLLREVLSVLEAAARQLGRPPVGYSIELKSTPAGDAVFHPVPKVFLALVLAELVRASVLPRTTLLSFDHRILRLAYATPAAVATCLLVEEDQRPWAASIQELGFIPTAFGPHFPSVTSEAVQALRNSFPRLHLVPWTVNETPDLHRMISCGVDGITTDYPNRLISILS